MISSLVNLKGEETVKYLEDKEFAGLVKGNADNSEVSLIIRYGNFVKNKIYSHKFMYNYNVTLYNNGQILVKGKGFNDYDEEIEEWFGFNINDVFEVDYVEEDEFTKNLHIIMIPMGEYIDIEVEA